MQLIIFYLYVDIYWNYYCAIFFVEVLLQAYVKDGRYNKLEPTLYEMENQGIYPDVNVYKILTNYCADHGHVDFAVQCLENMHSRSALAVSLSFSFSLSLLFFCRAIIFAYFL